MATTTSTSKTATKIDKPKDKANTLELKITPGVKPDRHMADLVTAGEAGNAWVTVQYSKGTFGELSLTQCVHSLRHTTTAVKGGDLSSAEALLTSQAVALNAIFGELSRRAALNMGEYLDATERYLRLALKAQGQCRATLETLAAIKNPPVVFARQANINNGGQQQVNNGLPTSTPASTRAGEIVSGQNELLEEGTYGGTTLDNRTKEATCRADALMAPLGAVNGAAKR